MKTCRIVEDRRRMNHDRHDRVPVHIDLSCLSTLISGFWKVHRGGVMWAVSSWSFKTCFGPCQEMYVPRCHQSKHGELRGEAGFGCAPPADIRDNLKPLHCCDVFLPTAAPFKHPEPQTNAFQKSTSNELPPTIIGAASGSRLPSS